MAYGVNAAFGLKPIRYLNGASWNDAVNEYVIDSGYNTSIFTNDPVTFANDGTINIGVAGSAIIGVFMGCKYIDPNGNYVASPYWPAATSVQAGSSVIAFVADDPNIIFDVQTNSSVGLTQTNIATNANFAAGAGSTVSGQSGYVLDQSTSGTTSTLNLKILRFTQNPINAPGIPYNNAEVMINNHIYKGGTGTTGI